MEKSSPDVMGGGRRPWRVGNQIDAEIGGRSCGGSLDLALDGGREGSMWELQGVPTIQR
jgi:hypothetical protein